MQEREEKLLKLYEDQQQRTIDRMGRGSAGSNTSLGSTGGGKVRQMFDERRTKAGVDRSYPLEPLKAKTNTRVPNTDRKTTTTTRTTVRLVYHCFYLVTGVNINQLSCIKLITHFSL